MESGVDERADRRGGDDVEVDGVGEPEDGPVEDDVAQRTAPMAVTAATTSTPKRSIPRRPAVRAPLTAKANTPARSIR
nr:hypothetical protein [Rubrobacter marinus]